MNFQGFATTKLALELRLSSPTPFMSENPTNHTKKRTNPCSDDHPNLEPSLTLALSGDSCVGSSSLSSDQKYTTSGDQEDDQDYGGGGLNIGKKKLRLTKAQSGLLEEAFKLHTSLNPKQKQELARDLKLRPRQVEVWFQNRRARTKLKQTEVDCEYLKKCRKILTEENKRLRQEIQALKVQKSGYSQPTYMQPQLPATTLTMCPSCEKIIGDTKTPFTQVDPKPYIFNPFAHSSAAC